MKSGQYEVERFTGVDFDGGSVGIILAKVTYSLGEDRVFEPAEDAESIRFAPCFRDEAEPTASPILFDSDSALVKPRTDFVVHGTAFAPKGRPVGSFDVEVVVGRQRRVLRVFGPRKASYRPARKTKKKTEYRPPAFSESTPVTKVPLDFTRAYGGVARYRVPEGDEVIEIPCPSNPLGRGYCVQNSPEGLDGLELPQVENPDALLTPENLIRSIGSPEDLPVPAGFGVYGPAWYPRVAYAGIMPHDMEEARARMREQASQLDPETDAATIAMLEDYDPPGMAPEFFQSAAPGMTFPYLDGDESVTLTNLTPSGLIAFNLPGRRPLVRLDREEGPLSLAADLDTVVFLVDEMRLVLTFRARCALTGPGETEEFPSRTMEIEDLDTKEYRRVLAR